MPEGTSVDVRAFRDVLGRFATGVTVLTMRDDAGPRGMTANAVTSVSLDPPLVLVCVDKSVSIYDAVQRADGFALNILGGAQRAVSEFFARHGREQESDPMGGFPYRDGGSGSPILEGTIGWVDCRVWRQYEGGDHTIVVGEVVDMELSESGGHPLVFYAGGYQQLDGSA